MKKLLVSALATAFLAVSLIPATAATTTTPTAKPMAAKTTKAAPAAKPGMKMAKGMKCSMHKTSKSIKKTCTMKHHKAAKTASATKTAK